MSKKTFIFYKDWEDYMEEMTLEEKGLFTQTILRYQNWKELWNISPIKFIWSKVKKQLETDNKKRAEELEKRSKAWIEGNKKRRGDRKSSQVIASATSGSQLIPVNDNDNVNDNENVNDNDNDNVKEIKLLTEEVKPVYWNADVNECLEIIKSFNDWICDWSVKDQRRYSNHLINKIKKTNSVSSWKFTRNEYLQWVLAIVTKNKFHNSKMSWPRKIFENLSALQKIANTDFKEIKDKTYKKTFNYNPFADDKGT